MRKLSFIILFNLFIGNVQCQSGDKYYILSNETIKKKDIQSLEVKQIEKIHPIGKYADKITFLGTDSSDNIHFFLYDESSNLLTADFFKVNQTKNKVLRARTQDDIIFLTGYYNVAPRFKDFSISNLPIDSHAYQHLWIQKGLKEYKIDSLPYHFIDKYYEYKFSDNTRYLICNPFTSLASSYSEYEDGKILLYDLQDMANEEVKKEVIQCDRCLNTFILGENIYFQKERPMGNGFDGDYHNIFKAPLKNISDTTLLAYNIEFILISPDKKYILGGQYLYGKYCPVIIDLEQKKFQYILGRDYPLDRCFYSTYEKKFAFDFDDRIIYVETPDVFPFDALKNHYRFTNQQDNAAFWKKFTH